MCQLYDTMWEVDGRHWSNHVPVLRSTEERCLRSQEKRNAGLNRDSKTARCEKSWRLQWNPRPTRRAGLFKSNYITTPTVSEILKDEFMGPLGISSYKLAQSINVPVSRIQDILHSRRKITIDTSIRLAKFFGISDRYFWDIQNDIDIRNLKVELATKISKIPLCQSSYWATQRHQKQSGGFYLW